MVDYRKEARLCFNVAAESVSKMHNNGQVRRIAAVCLYDAYNYILCYWIKSKHGIDSDSTKLSAMYAVVNFTKLKLPASVEAALSLATSWDRENLLTSDKIPSKLEVVTVLKEYRGLVQAIYADLDKAE